MSLRLSVLDQSPICRKARPAPTRCETPSISRSVPSRLAISRYWVAEHHGTPMLACASPEVLIGAIAAATARIRVGSGGVMLPHYSPLKVAETFSMLSALYPDRIDLGGRPRAGQRSAHRVRAAARSAAVRRRTIFPSSSSELLAYLCDRMPPDHRFARLAALPGRPARPDVLAARLVAAERRLGGGAGAAVRVRRLHQPGWAQRSPLTTAQHFTPSRRQPGPSGDRRRRGRSARTPTRRRSGSPRAAGWRSRCSCRGRSSRSRRSRRRSIFSRGIRGAWRRWAAGGASIVGSPDRVRAGIEALAAEYGADEVMIVTITYDHAARRRSVPS